MITSFIYFQILLFQLKTIKIYQMYIHANFGLPRQASAWQEYQGLDAPSLKIPPLNWRGHFEKNTRLSMLNICLGGVPNLLYGAQISFHRAPKFFLIALHSLVASARSYQVLARSSEMFPRSLKEVSQDLRNVSAELRTCSEALRFCPRSSKFSLRSSVELFIAPKFAQRNAFFLIEKLA